MEDDKSGKGEKSVFKDQKLESAMRGWIWERFSVFPPRVNEGKARLAVYSAMKADMKGKTDEWETEQLDRSVTESIEMISRLDLDNLGQTAVSRKDSITGEIIVTRLRKEKDGWTAEEAGADGRIISAATIREEEALLTLDYTGDRYKGKNPGLTGDSRFPTAAKTVFVALAGVVAEEKLMEYEQKTGISLSKMVRAAELEGSISQEELAKCLDAVVPWFTGEGKKNSEDIIVRLEKAVTTTSLPQAEKSAAEQVLTKRREQYQSAVRINSEVKVGKVNKDTWGSITAMSEYISGMVDAENPYDSDNGDTGRVLSLCEAVADAQSHGRTFEAGELRQRIAQYVFDDLMDHLESAGMYAHAGKDYVPRGSADIDEYRSGIAAALGAGMWDESKQAEMRADVDELEKVNKGLSSGVWNNIVVIWNRSIGEGDQDINAFDLLKAERSALEYAYGTGLFEYKPKRKRKAKGNE